MYSCVFGTRTHTHAHIHIYTYSRSGLQTHTRTHTHTHANNIQTEREDRVRENFERAVGEAHETVGERATELTSSAEWRCVCRLSHLEQQTLL